MAQLVKNPPAMRGDLVSIPGSGRSPGKGKGYPLQLFLGFPGGSAGKEFACSGRDLGSIPGLGRSPGGGHGNPLQCSCLENPRDRGAWWAAVHGAAESRTRLSDSVQQLGLQEGLISGPSLQHICRYHSFLPTHGFQGSGCGYVFAGPHFRHQLASATSPPASGLSRAWTEDFPSSRSCRGGTYTRLLWNLTTTPRYLGHSLLGKGCVISLMWEILPSCP